jgi:hypothetical protein
VFVRVCHRYKIGFRGLPVNGRVVDWVWWGRKKRVVF